MAHSNGTTVKYSTDGGSNYTAFPCPVVSIDPPQGSTTNVNRSHLNNTLALAVTSPGNRQPGKLVFHCECDSRTDAHFDFWQLVNGWWKNRTESIKFKIEYPKATGDTTGPTVVHTGYCDQQPHLTSPEDDRMMLDIQIQCTDEEVLTDGA